MLVVFTPRKKKMSLESVGDISHSILQSELVPQFAKNLATIKGRVNAGENPEVENKVYSLKDFITNKPTGRADINNISQIAASKINEIKESECTTCDNKTLTESSSTISSEIVNCALSKGCSPYEAINVGKASNAYANIGKLDVVKVLSTQTHVVS